MWPGGAYSPHWVCDVTEGSYHKRSTPTRHQKSHLTTRHNSGEPTHCSASLLWELLVLLLSLLLILFTKRQEKDPSASRSGTSKFEVSTGIFQKTVHLGNPGNCTVKDQEASPLTLVQDLLFQMASFKGTSQQGGHAQPSGGTCLSGSTNREDVGAALPRTAWKPERALLVVGWWQQLFLKPAEHYVSLHDCRKLSWSGEPGDQGKDCS